MSSGYWIGWLVGDLERTNWKIGDKIDYVWTSGSGYKIVRIFVYHVYIQWRVSMMVEAVKSQMFMKIYFVNVRKPLSPGIPVLA